MRKGLLPLLIIFCSLLISFNAFAGDINSAEQRILDVISITYSYKGNDYKVTAEYYAKVVEYLSRDDVDMTQKEVSSYILQFYDNIPAGIAGGYLEFVGVTPSNKKPSKTSAEDNSSDDITQQEETGDTEVAESVSQNSNVQVTTTPQPTQESQPTETPAAQTTPVKEITTTAPSEPEVVSELEDKTIAATTEGMIEYTVSSFSAVMYVWDIDELQVHKDAYKDSDVIGSYIKGEQVTITGITDTGWAQVDYHGETGYTSAVYLRTTAYMADNEIEKNDETGDYVPKDYSDAAPLSNSINIGMMASIVVILIIIICVGIVLYHRSKHNRR